MAEHIQWGVQYKTLLYGPYDKVEHGFQKPFTEEEARTYTKLANESRADLPDPEPYARLVTRTITDWEPKEDE